MFDAGRFTDHLARHVFGIEKRVRPTAERDRQAADKVCEKVRDEWEGDHRDVSLDAIHGNIHRLLLGHHEWELVRFAFGELVGDVARRNEPRRDHGDAHIVIAHQLRSDRERESRAEHGAASRETWTWETDRMQTYMSSRTHIQALDTVRCRESCEDHTMVSNAMQ